MTAFSDWDKVCLTNYIALTMFFWEKKWKWILYIMDVLGHVENSYFWGVFDISRKVREIILKPKIAEQRACYDHIMVKAQTNPGSESAT